MNRSVEGKVIEVEVLISKSLLLKLEPHKINLLIGMGGGPIAEATIKNIGN